jgi:hypothetical protein
MAAFELTLPSLDIPNVKPCFPGIVFSASDLAIRILAAIEASEILESTLEVRGVAGRVVKLRGKAFSAETLPLNCALYDVTSADLGRTNEKPIT